MGKLQIILKLNMKKKIKEHNNTGKINPETVLNF